ncbi:MAG: SPW repeat domain-containing protein [Betaproteobacteria bacterium]
MKILSPYVHGILDYALGAVFLLAPSLFGMESTAAGLAHAIGIALVVVSLITRYPLGLFKLIPFPVHGVLESLMALAWIAAPWLFGFSADAAGRNFFIVAGVGLLAVAAMTDYQGVMTTRSAWTGPNRRIAVSERRHLSLAMLDERRRNPDRRRAAYAAVA